MAAAPRCKIWDFSTLGLCLQDIINMTDAIYVHNKKLEVEKIIFDTHTLRGAGFSIGKMMATLHICVCWDISNKELAVERTTHFVKEESGIMTSLNVKHGLDGNDLSEVAAQLGSKELNIQTLDLQGNNLNGCGFMLARVMAALPTCKIWNLGRTGIQANDLKIMASVLQCLKLQAEVIDLHGNHLTGAGVSIGELFIILTLCKTWNLAHAKLTEFDMKDIAKTITEKHQSEVENISFQGNCVQYSGKYLGQLMIALRKCKFWNLSATRLSNSDLRDLAENIGENTLQVETMLLDGKESFCRKKDADVLGNKMPLCHFQYTNEPREELEAGHTSASEISSNVEPLHLKEIASKSNESNEEKNRPDQIFSTGNNNKIEQKISLVSDRIIDELDAKLVPMISEVQAEDDAPSLKNALRLCEIELLGIYLNILKKMRETQDEYVKEKLILELQGHIERHASIYKLFQGQSLVWILRPHSYESLCELEKVYRTGILCQMLKEDVRRSSCFSSFDLENLIYKIHMPDDRIRTCKEELLVGKACLLQVGKQWLDDAPLGNRAECFTCIHRLAEQHLLVTSPYIATYLWEHDEILLKLGNIALTQTLTREENLERIASENGVSISDSFSDGFQEMISSKLDLSGVASNDVEVLIQWLSKCSMYSYSDHFSKGILIGKLMSSFSHLKSWSLINMGLKKEHVDGMIVGFGDRNIQVERLLLSYNNLHGAGSSLGCLIVAIPNCKSLDLCKTGLVADDIKDIVQSIGETKLQTNEFIFHLNNLRRAGASLGKLMLAFPDCNYWDFSTANLDEEDITDIANTLKSHRLEVEQVSLSCASLAGKGIGIGNLMQVLHSCQTLNLSNTEIKVHPGTNVSKVPLGFERRGQDAAYSIQTETAADVGTELLSTGINSKDMANKVQTLSSTNVDITNESKVSLDFQKRGQDTAFSIQTEAAADDGTELLSTGINSSDIANMVQTLSGKNLDIKNMEMQGNYLLDAGLHVGLLMSSLRKCVRWDLRNASLSTEDVRNMTAALVDVDLETEEVDFEGNFLSGAGSCIAKLFIAMPRCRDFSLCWTNFMARDIKDFEKTIGDKIFNEVKVMKIHGNCIHGSGWSLGRIMSALPKCKVWNLQGTQLDTEDFTKICKSFSSSLPKRPCKVQSLILDGTEDYYGEEDKEMFSAVMPECTLLYTNRPRGQIFGAETRLEEPEMELTITKAEVSRLPSLGLSGLPDHGCLLSNSKGCIRLDRHGRGRELYDNGKRFPIPKDQFVNGMILQGEAVFMIHAKHLTKVDLQTESVLAGDFSTVSVYRSDGEPANLPAEYKVQDVGQLTAGLACGEDKLILVDNEKGTVVHYDLTSKSVQILVKGLRKPCAISQYRDGDEALYFVTENTANRVSVYNSVWNPCLTIGRFGSEDGELRGPRATALTPEGTLLVADRDNRRVSEFSLQGDFICHVFTGMKNRPCHMSLQEKHIWILFDNGSTTGYALYH